MSKFNTSFMNEEDDKKVVRNKERKQLHIKFNGISMLFETTYFFLKVLLFSFLFFFALIGIAALIHPETRNVMIKVFGDTLFSFRFHALFSQLKSVT